MSDSDDFTQLDDPAFLALRSQVREQLEHTPENQVSPELAARYRQLNEEFLRRARPGRTTEGEPTMSNAPGLLTLHSQAARLLAVEVLLAEPEALADDVLESCLYLLRDRLQDIESEDEAIADGTIPDAANQPAP